MALGAWGLQLSISGGADADQGICHTMRLAGSVELSRFFPLGHGLRFGPCPAYSDLVFSVWRTLGDRETDLRLSDPTFILNLVHRLQWATVGCDRSHC